MKISELIKILKKIKEERSDISIYTFLGEPQVPMPSGEYLYFWDGKLSLSDNKIKESWKIE